MSLLVEIQERLQEVGAALGRLESSLAHDPSSPSLLANIRSLRSFQLHLEEEFASETAERGQDICSYRLFAEHFHPTAGAVVSALGRFQKALSVNFDALHGELFLAAFAEPNATGRNVGVLFRSTARALDAVRPTKHSRELVCAVNI